MRGVKVNFSGKKKIAERRRQKVNKSIVKTQRQRQITPVGESRSSLDPRVSDTARHWKKAGETGRIENKLRLTFCGFV